MTENVIPYPEAAAARERCVADSAEAQALMKAIADAVQAYSDFLERHDLIWGTDDDPQQKVQALVARLDYNDINQPIEIYLKGGALDQSGDSHWRAARAYRITRKS